MRKPELVLLIGIQGSGKSTFFRTHFSATHVHVSKDLMGSARRKNDRQEREIRAALAAGDSVVIDNTQPSRLDREPWIRLGHSLGARVIGYYFPPDLEGSLRRNGLRAGRARVPELAIHATLRRLDPPEREEGFDEIFVVAIHGEQFAIRPPASDDAPDAPREE